MIFIIAFVVCLALALLASMVVVLRSIAQHLRASLYVQREQDDHQLRIAIALEEINFRQRRALSRDP